MLMLLAAMSPSPKDPRPWGHGRYKMRGPSLRSATRESEHQSYPLSGERREF